MIKFTELEIWQKSHLLSLEIYRITKEFPECEKYGIVSQIQRSASSISANIAEGYNRRTKKDFVRFLYQSKGSLAETLNFILLSKDLGYIDPKKSEYFLSQYELLFKKLNSFITYLRNYGKPSIKSTN